MTYVADVNYSTLVAVGSSVVSEWVGGAGRHRGALLEAATGVTTTTRRTTEAPAAAEATTEATTSDKSTAAAHGATETAATSHGSSKATTAAAAKASTAAGKSVLADFKRATLPVVTIELLNGDTGIVGGLESNNTRALGASGGIGVHVSTNDGTILSCIENQVNSSYPLTRHVVGAKFRRG